MKCLTDHHLVRQSGIKVRSDNFLMFHLCNQILQVLRGVMEGAFQIYTEVIAWYSEASF